MKNIAIVCNYTLNPARIGGMDRFFVAYDKACKAKGFQAKWFFSSGEYFRFYDKLDMEISSQCPLEEFFLEFQKENHWKFDIVITHFVELCTPFFKKIKQCDNPKIIAVDHNPRPINGFSLKKRWKNKIKGELYSQYIDVFIGVSVYTKRQILKDYGRKLNSKTEVVHNGIAVEEYSKRKEINHGKFIVASHLRPSKGIQDIIKAVGLLKPNIRQDIKIDIFGEGPMEEKLKKIVKAENLENQIHFRGSSPKLPKLFKNYSYLLQPTYMECFSLSILESLAANVPVITTSVGGNLEVVENEINGFIFEPGNIQQLSEIICDILQNKKIIQKPVNTLIENKYYLEKMVADHLCLLVK
ncbi:glycosyltransferase family 4 protein [uncultured Salegentibacter sp.]|uniref:glycosyltransferase family 4 protein n=1 Tax=uncultured Salegentibacter sp. TaxID=259320 RepID=UPI0030DC773C